MALYLTGDTHGDFRRFLPGAFSDQYRMTKEDIVLICGDFGGVWYGDSQDDFLLGLLDKQPFTTAFVSGNHENYDALRSYPTETWNRGIARKIRPSVILLERGQIFNLCGKQCFTMGGASSHDISGGILEPNDPMFQIEFQRLVESGAAFRINHQSWWCEELPSQHEYEDAKKT